VGFGDLGEGKDAVEQGLGLAGQRLHFVADLPPDFAAEVARLRK